MGAALSRLGITPFTADVGLKKRGVLESYGLRCWIHDRSVRIIKAHADLLAKALNVEQFSDISAALLEEDLPLSHDIDAFLVHQRWQKPLIDALLKGDVSTDQAIDLPLLEASQESGYGVAMILVYLYIGRCLADVVIQKIGRPTYGIGVNLVPPRKFDVTLSFIQFTVECIFEGFEVDLSFDQLHVEPHFQEV
jgi:hypothetical protein